MTTIANKKIWEKPIITPVRPGMKSKFGASMQGSWQSNVEGIPVRKLLDIYGSPLFVVSEKKLRDNIVRWQKVFSSRYPNVTFAWSYKTNYLAAVCSVFHTLGSWAEVVSAFEYQKARKTGVPGNRIIFNGPNKTVEALRTAILEQSLIHIDHLDELYLLDKLSDELNQDVNVAIRLNFETGYTENWARFGFNVESGQAMNAVWRLAATKHLKLTGLHSHIGTFVMEPLAYNAQARIMCEFMSHVEERTSFKIDYLDLGGGFASLNSLQGIYLPSEQVIPSLEQYADAICTVLLECNNQRLLNGREPLHLFLEAGRALVDDAEILISTVVATKHLADGRRALVMDAGVNHLFTAFWYNHQVTPTRLLEGRSEETVIYGPLCMNIDVMRASVMLPPLNRGDSLIFSPVGAYNNTQWLQFIEYRPAVVLIHGEQQVSVIRDAENLETMTSLERLPEHLRFAFCM